MMPNIDRNFLSENEVISKFFSGDCALIRVKELIRLQNIEKKFNSIWNIIATKDSGYSCTWTK